MIPLRLSVKNFMCYREPPDLDFKPLRVACLCGMNGHGKSALLDAITWALWGEARTRTQDELIHQGQNDMSVELDFSARHRVYRVSRRHSRKKGKQGSTMLELQVESHSGFVPITGNTVRDTESAIRDLLHMDYDTFINTAFLIQGRADLFTSATPGKRKGVLADVLNLSYYDTLARRALERAKENSRRIDAIDAIIDGEALKLSEISCHEAELSEAEERSRILDSELRNSRDEFSHLRQEVSRLKSQKAELEQLATTLEIARADLESLVAQAEKHNSRINELQTLVATAADVDTQFNALKTEKARSLTFDNALTSLNRLVRDRSELEKELAVQKARLTSELHQERKRAVELQAVVDALPLIRERQTSLENDRKAAESLHQRVEAQRYEISALQSDVKVLDSEADALLYQMEETRKRFDLLASESAECPVCKKTLENTSVERLRAEYEIHGKGAKENHAENRSQAKLISKQIAQLQARLGKDISLVQRVTSEIDLRTAEISHGMKTSTEATEVFRQVAIKIQELESTLENNSLAGHSTDRIATLDAKIKDLNYDADLHQATKERILKLDRYSELHIRLQNAKSDLPEEAKALDLVVSMTDRRKQEIDGIERAFAELSSRLESLGGSEAKLANFSERLAKLESEKSSLNELIGALRERIANLHELAANVAEKTKLRHKAASEKSIYDELGRAFGKNGIQALVIETVIPQITEQASELLNRLTDGQMSMRLELSAGRRDRTTGEPAEQLEIKIADEMGTRSYETFSGGEAFRINFAIRIALSRLLASRSGAPLPILFIDEGFGSQDGTGQDRLREAIASIEDEFQKILVITHIDAVKDSFPVRIEVQKTAAGSTFTVS